MDELARRIDANTVCLERLLPLPPARAWAYLTESSLMATWLAPGTVEPRVGGRVELKFEPDDSPRRDRPGARIEGQVGRYEPATALSYGWVDPKTPAGASEVAFTLEPRGEATLLRITHGKVAEAGLSSVAAAWHTHAELLLAHLAGKEAPPFPSLFKPLRERYQARFSGS